jgi:hypothetical protein
LQVLQKNRASLTPPFTFILLNTAHSLMSHLWSDLRILIHCQMSIAFFSFPPLLVSHVANQILNQLWLVFLVGDLLSLVGNSINVIQYEGIYSSFIVQSVLQQGHSLSQSRYSKESKECFPFQISVSSLFLNVIQPVHVFFLLIFPSYLSFLS